MRMLCIDFSTLSSIRAKNKDETAAMNQDVHVMVNKELGDTTNLHKSTGMFCPTAVYDSYIYLSYLESSTLVGLLLSLFQTWTLLLIRYTWLRTNPWRQLCAGKGPQSLRGAKEKQVETNVIWWTIVLIGNCEEGMQSTHREELRTHNTRAVFVWCNAAALP
jgi:hypothetical protein